MCLPQFVRSLLAKNLQLSLPPSFALLVTVAAIFFYEIGYITNIYPHLLFLLVYPILNVLVAELLWHKTHSVHLRAVLLSLVIGGTGHAHWTLSNGLMKETKFCTVIAHSRVGP
jgi:uncharacterized membrane protein YoaK (UPF0700 family)